MKRLGLTGRLLILTSLIVACSSVVSIVIALIVAKESLVESLSTELLAIVNSSVYLIDPDAHENIFRTSPDRVDGWDEFIKIQSLLIKVRDANQLLSNDNHSPLYTLRKTYDFESSQELEFVVMTNKNTDGHLFVGNRIAAEPHHLDAFNGNPVTTPLYKDSEGYWISAISPLVRNGEVVALLQADREIRFFLDHLWRLTVKLLLGAFGIIILVTAVTYLLARQWVRPILQLVQATGTITSDQEDRELPSIKGTEVEDLADNFNMMIKNLKNYMNLAFNNEIEKEALEKKNRAKNLFLANMSHEIRTPMHGIQGLAGLLLESELNKKQQHYAQTIIELTQSLLSVINNILDISKMEAGEFKINRINFDFYSFIEEMRLIAVTLSKEKGINIVIDTDPAIPKHLYGDAIHTRQVILNLIGNAVKFTSEGSVTLKTVLENKKNDNLDIEFHIMDTGIGISEHMHTVIFEDFQQVEDNACRAYEGSGLGLAICKNIINQLGGEIGLHSAKGEGSDFWVKLSFSEARQEGKNSSQLSNPIQTLGIKKPSVMVVDDNNVNRMLVLSSINKWAGSALSACDGLEAVECFKKRDQHIDIILMDCMMPNMNGYTATEEIRKIEQNKSNTKIKPVLIIGLSADAFEENKCRCINSGMDAFLAKPFRIEELKELIISHWN